MDAVHKQIKLKIIVADVTASIAAMQLSSHIPFSLVSGFVKKLM